MLIAIVYWGRHHEHSLSTAIRSIINSTVLILGKIADIVIIDLNKTRTLCSADYTFRENTAYHIRKESHYIKLHLHHRKGREWA